MKEEASLIERAEKYLSSAKLLLDAGDNESCVSRAYYAMFFAAEAALLSRNLHFSSHKGVITAFQEHFIKTGMFPIQMAKDLRRAFDKRQLSDYEFRFTVKPPEAEQVLGDSVQFVGAIARWLGEHRT